ncbi:carbohydrate esterase family 4 protein [Podospora appendiculata]|uniref:Carbohydrate esterase family 4 protein n=1 Tax=Podospora appendiculata TaxID=314037 RepID=A0AAE0XEK6_9PEZI|nr:carbohydrate esterase family 4 protein [Podospora appendiculata]
MYLPKLIPFGMLLSQEHDTNKSANDLVRRAPDAVPRGYIIEHCTVPGVVALTFDDGPYTFTNHVLDLLDQYNAKATFFINGDNWSRHIDRKSTPWPETLRRMVGSGHQVGSHTWSHADLTAADSATRRREMYLLEKALVKVLGRYPTYFRPPYATCSPQCLAEVEQMGYHVINFDVDPKDYLYNQPWTVDEAMRRFSQAVDAGQPGSSFLVLSHDVQEQTAKTLTPFMLQKIHEHGYRAVTVGECLGDPPENWRFADDIPDWGDESDKDTTTWFGSWLGSGYGPVDKYVQTVLDHRPF